MAPAWLEKFIVRADTTPDPLLASGQPVQEFHYTVIADHRRTVSKQGDTVPRYEVTRRAILGAWGNKCTVTSPAAGGKEIAVLDFHAIPRNYTQIAFSPDSGHGERSIAIHTTDPHFEAGGGLGRLHWKDTGMVAYGAASWELRDETSMLLSVSIDGHQANGVLGLWRDGLHEDTLEELVVVGIARIEAYKRLLRESKTAAMTEGGAAKKVWKYGAQGK
ncbi:hypothetical protein SVAN01_02746 [Stagonosporopsis vannaccii]|nr:hypothetical protein SVAN01_02746 [Stagonosporopsis vannaccii]